jgi:hypothetical protein
METRKVVFMKNRRYLASLGGVLCLQFLLALSLLVSACTSVTRAPDPLQAEQRDDVSMVVVSITTNTAQVNGFDGISLRRINASDDRAVDLHGLIQIVPDLSRDTSVFVGMLREGEYEFAEFTDSQTQRSLVLSTGSQKLLGRIKVTRDKAVDLGRLVLTPANTQVLLGRSAKITSNKPLLERFAPEYAELLQGEVSEGWVTDRSKQDRIEEYAMSRPVGLGSPEELEDGTVIAGSRLGTVLIRLPNGRWKAIRSDRLATLHYAKPVKLASSRMVAVGELGTLLHLPRDGKMLVPLDIGNLPPGNLLFIDGDSEHGWYVVHQLGSVITIYRSMKLEAGDWQPLRQEIVKDSFWSGKNKFWVWPTPQGLGYAVSNGSVNQFDYSSGEWQSFKAPKGSSLLDVVSNPDGFLGILTSPGGGITGIFTSAYVSKDGGATWREIETKHNLKLFAPIQLTSNRLLAATLANVSSGLAELNVSYDGGATWIKTAGDYSAHEKIIPLQGGRMLAVNPASNGIFLISFSDDVGANWRLEYTNFDNAMYESKNQEITQ